MAINGILDFFITTASAQTRAAAPAQPNSGFTLLIMMVIFVGFLYLTVWRPQNKKAKEQQDMLNALTVNDEVSTIGGILGTISKISMSYIVLKVSPTTEITVQKSAIANVLPKGTLKSI